MEAITHAKGFLGLARRLDNEGFDRGVIEPIDRQHQSAQARDVTQRLSGPSAQPAMQGCGLQTEFRPGQRRQTATVAERIGRVAVAAAAAHDVAIVPTHDIVEHDHRAGMGKQRSKIQNDSSRPRRPSP